MSIKLNDIGDGTPFPGGSSLAQVTDFTFTGSTLTTATFTFTQPAQGTALGYRVYDANTLILQQEFEDSAWSLTGGTLTGLEQSTNYSFYILTYDADGQGEASTSASVSTVSTLYNPEDLFGEVPVNNTVEITWTPTTRGTADGYKVINSSTGATIATIPDSTWVLSSYMVIGLAYDSTTLMHLITYDEIGESIASNQISVVVGASSEIVYYEENYDGGVTFGTVNPVFTWADIDNYSSGNIFEEETTIVNNGTSSLRINMEGRNGICNRLFNTDTKGLTHHASPSYGGTNYFVDSLGIDLSTIRSVGDIIWNVDNRWSKWEITGFANAEATNDRANLTLLANAIDGSEGATEFKNGDEVLIASVQADGVVSRITDCDVAVANLGNDQDDLVGYTYGQSIYRRVYLRMDSTGHHHQKCWYAQTGGKNGEQVSTNVMFAIGDTSVGSVEAQMQHLNPDYPDLSPVKVILDTVGIFEPGIWYYIEMQILLNTSFESKDGEMHIWFHEKGSETDTKALSVTGVNHGLPQNFSVWGNHQSSTNIQGSWYQDNLKISNKRIGWL